MMSTNPCNYSQTDVSGVAYQIQAVYFNVAPNVDGLSIGDLTGYPLHNFYFGLDAQDTTNYEFVVSWASKPK